RAMPWRAGPSRRPRLAGVIGSTVARASGRRPIARAPSLYADAIVFLQPIENELLGLGADRDRLVVRCKSGLAGHLRIFAELVGCALLEVVPCNDPVDGGGIHVDHLLWCRAGQVDQLLRCK